MARIATLDRASRITITVVAGLLAVLLFVVPPLLSLYWIDVFTATAIYAVVALGLALLMGRVGLVSLGQIALLALGGGAPPPRSARSRPSPPARGSPRG